MGLLGSLAFTAISLFAARLLLKPPKGKIGNKEYEPSTRATRGSWIPILLGTDEVEPVVCFVGDRKIVQESSGGKGLFGGSAGTGQNVYYESAMHVLTVGPCSKLTAILQDGKVIWEGPITPDTTPSGTTINTGTRGRFTIYWGEIDQPINDELAKASRIGIASRWPYICYVWWYRKRLSSSPFWPRLTYILSAEAESCSPLYLSDQVLSQVVDGETVEGLNPAHAIAQLLTADFPHGAAIPPEYIDKNSLEEFGILMQDEHLPINMLLSEGPEFSRPVQTILQDMGVMLVQEGEHLLTLPMRDETDPVPDFSRDILSPPEMERDIEHGDLPTSQIVFLYRDQTDYKYKDVDIPFDDDGQNLELGRSSNKDERIDSVTHNSVANKIARRRLQELSIQGSIRVSALRGARLMLPSQAFTTADFGKLRIVSVENPDDSAEVTLQVVPDVYGVADIDDHQSKGSGGSDSLPLAVAEDVAVTWFELPADLSSEITIIVFRIRAHQQIVSAGVWASADETTYTFLNNQDNPAQGGILEEAVSMSTDDIIATGPAFESLSDDIDSVLDLSSDQLSWQQGRQLAAINGEIFFLESITVVAETAWSSASGYSIGDTVRPTDGHGPTGLRYKCTVAGLPGATEPDWPETVGDTVTDGGVTWEARRFAYTPNNMIRAAYGTSKEDHSIGDTIFIMDSALIVPMTNPIMLQGISLCIKTQPATSSDIIDLSSVDPVCALLEGLALDYTSLLVYDGSDNYPLVTHVGDQIITGE